MKVKVFYGKMSPFCFLPNGNLVCYKLGKLFVFKDQHLIKNYNIFNTYKEKYLSKINLLSRILRLLRK